MTTIRRLTLATALLTSVLSVPGAAEARGPAGREPQVHAVPRGRYHLYAREYPGTDPAYVLMHGFPDNSHLYDRLVPELSGHHVIVFDFLGWGRSDKPQHHPYTFANQLGDLDAVIRAFDLERVHLVAHDAAGPSAVNWALDHPDRTASLTLMNAFYQPTPTTRPPALIALLALGHLDAPILGTDLAGSLGAIGEEIARRPATFLPLFEWQEREFFSRRRDADHFVPLFARQFAGTHSSRPALRSLTGDLIAAVAANAGRMSELGAFPRPVRLIWGEQDQDLNVGIARALHDATPTSELFVLPQAHHNLQIDEPRRVAELLTTIPS